MKYRLTPQERDDYCLCAALQAILKNHEVNLSQREIANNLTPSQRGFLVDDRKIRDFLKSKGLEYIFYWQDKTPFNERDVVLAEMHKYEGIVGINYHTYLLESFKDPRLRLIDPADNTIKEKELREVLKEMRQYEGCFGIIKRLK